MTRRVRDRSSRFVNATVAKGWTFPPTNVVPCRVPPGYAVRLNPVALVAPRVRIAGRDDRSPDVAVSSKSPARSRRTRYAPLASAVARNVVPFVRSIATTSAPGTAAPSVRRTDPAIWSPGTARSCASPAAGTLRRASPTVRPEVVTFTYVDPWYTSRSS